MAGPTKPHSIGDLVPGAKEKRKVTGCPGDAGHHSKSTGDLADPASRMDRTFLLLAIGLPIIAMRGRKPKIREVGKEKALIFF